MGIRKTGSAFDDTAGRDTDTARSNGTDRATDGYDTDSVSDPLGDSDTRRYADTDTGTATGTETVSDTDTGTATGTETVSDTDTGTATGTETVSDTGTGTATSTGTLPDTGISTDSERETDTRPQSCDTEGALYDGLCWYLSNPDESCSTTCSTRGGYHPETSSYVGSEAQGGSEAKCRMLFSLLGHDAVINVIQATLGVGLGCYTGAGVYYWQPYIEFDPNVASTRGRSMVCGCYPIR